MTEQWRQQMQQKMADYRRPAPEVSWEELERAVTASQRHTPVKWLRVAAMALVLLLAGAGGYWALTTTNTGKEMVQHNMVQALHDTEKASQRLKAQQPLPPIVQCQSKVPAQQSQMSQESVTESTSDLLVVDTAEAVSVGIPEGNPIQKEKTEKNIAHEHQRATVIYPLDLHKSPSSRLTAKVYMTNVMANSSNVNTNSQMLMSTTIHKQTFEVIVPCQSGDASLFEYEYEGNELSKENTILQIGTMSYQVTVFDTVKTYRMQLTEEQVHHHQPVRFGLSLRYQFDNRWSVETGVSYTRLTSDFLKNVDNVFTSKIVHTDYIGLPLHVGYQLWSGRYVGVYTLAGGMVEKALDNTMWQFSLNGAAGVEFKLNGLFSVYAEPGLGYYFDNRSSTPTLYQEKPLNFNLGLGLRFLFK